MTTTTESVCRYNANGGGHGGAALVAIVPRGALCIAVDLLLGIAILVFSVWAAVGFRRRARQAEPLSALERLGWNALPLVPLAGGVWIVITLIQT